MALQAYGRAGTLPGSVDKGLSLFACSKALLLRALVTFCMRFYGGPVCVDARDASNRYSVEFRFLLGFLDGGSFYEGFCFGIGGKRLYWLGFSTNTNTAFGATHPRGC